MLDAKNSQQDHESCSPTDAVPPEDVYLCQVGEKVSCAACCGLYNVRHPDREHLTAMLARRTDDFAGVPRTVQDMLDFKAFVESRERQDRPFPDFHHCPFIGLVGTRKSRAGCLLHPLGQGNKGVDLRGLSHWGGAACRYYFCPSCYKLPRRYKVLIKALIEDWYEYGQIVTEHRLLNACLSEVEAGVGHRLDPDALLSNPEAALACRALLRLKLHWPYRANGAGPGCHDFFDDRPRPRLHGEKANDIVSPYTLIASELETRPSDITTPDQALASIRDLLAYAIARIRS